LPPDSCYANAMKDLCYLPAGVVNTRDLGLEVQNDQVFVPERLRSTLERIGVRTADALAAALQSFPTSFSTQVGLSAEDLRSASAGALEKLKAVVDPQLFGAPDPAQRRGYGALPPSWLRRNGS
jgi:hypothetical protein